VGHAADPEYSLVPFHQQSQTLCHDGLSCKVGSLRPKTRLDRFNGFPKGGSAPSGE